MLNPYYYQALQSHLITSLSEKQPLALASRLGIVPGTEGLLVLLPVRAHAWVFRLDPWWGVCTKQLINVLLSHKCFSPSLSKNQ